MRVSIALYGLQTCRLGVYWNCAALDGFLREKGWAAILIGFKDMGVEHYKALTKGRLLAEWECIDQEMYAYLTADTFDSQCQVEVP